MIEACSKIPEEYRPAERFITVCGRCGAELLKRNAMALYIKRGSYSNPKILLHFCVACYSNFLDDYGVSEK